MIDLNIDFHCHTIFSDGSHTPEEMIKFAIKRKIHHLIITDHMDDHGFFVHQDLHKGASNDIWDYLVILYKLKEKYSSDIQIYAGFELATDFHHHKANRNPDDQFAKYLKYFSMILVEGWYIKDPINSALNLKSYLENFKISDIPVIIAHPEFDDINFSEFISLVENGIGFEFNESKFSPFLQDRFLELYSQCDSNQQRNIKITLGSDAHHKSDVGILTNVKEFVIQNHLSENIQYPCVPLRFLK